MVEGGIMHELNARAEGKCIICPRLLLNAQEHYLKPHNALPTGL